MVPFLSGLDDPAVCGLLDGLLGEEVRRRPGWAAALLEAEAQAAGQGRGLRLYPNAEALVQVGLCWSV